MSDGLQVFYLPRLDASELTRALRWTFYAYDQAPRLCGWLADALIDEQTRRLESRTGPPAETELLCLPFHKWSNAELQQALTLVTVLSYCVHDYGVGQLVDALVLRMSAAVGARLRRMEETWR